MIPVRRIAALAFVGTLLSLPAASRAAGPPDAGQIFQQQQQPPVAQPAAPETKKPKIEEGGDFRPAARPKQAPASTSATRRVPVKAFHLTGLTVAPEATVQALLGPHRNRDSTLTDLHEAATTVQNYLRSLGYYVRVYVPTQDVKDGVVELHIVESRIGAIEIKRGEGLRVDDATISRYFAYEGQAAGQLLQQSKVEGGLLKANELAGVRARAILVPGKDPGSTTVLVDAAADPFAQGTLSADNGGNKFTGRARLNADLKLNSPLHLGDQLSAQGSASSHSDFVRLAYSVPVGASGLALGGAYAYNSYRLCCEFAPLQQNGWAQVGNLFGSYPLLRSLGASVTATLAYADKRIVSQALGAVVSDHRETSWTPGLNGNWQDRLGGTPALSSWGLQLSLGKLDLSSSPDLATDRTTAASNGSFQKTLFNFARVQRLDEKWTLQAAVRGQVASKNLDSSEKLFLGGIGAVRAYPTGEAIGDSGFVFNAEAQRTFAPEWSGGVFLDYGYIQLHQNPWANWQAGNTTIENKYSLAGAGLSVTWTPNPRVTARVMLAAPIGSNPGRDVNGRNSENAKDGARAWGALSWSF